MGAVDRVLFVSVVGLPITLIDVIIALLVQTQAFLELIMIIIAPNLRT